MDHALALPSPDVLMKNKTKPIHEVRLGYIKAAVWRNETETGVRYNVTFSRLYKDRDQWKSTETFGRDDLLLLGKVADQTHSWILAKSQEHSSESSSGGSQSSHEKPSSAAAGSAPDKRATHCEHA